MQKKFSHKNYEPYTDCDWSVTGDDADKIVEAAAEHILHCPHSVKKEEDCRVVRAVIRAMIRDVETK